MTAREPQRHTQRLTLALTPHEERAVVAVAALRGVPKAHLLREISLNDVLAYFEKVQETLEPEPATAA